MNVTDVLKSLTSIVKEKHLGGTPKISGNDKLLYGSVEKGYSRKEILLDLDWSDSYFKSQSTRLRKRLFRQLFFVNLEGLNEFQNAWLKCHREYATMKILVVLHARSLAMFVAEKSLSLAIKYELSQISYDFSRELMAHYSNSGNKNKFDYFKKIAKDQFKIQEAELLAESHFYEIALNFSNKRIPPESVLPALKEINLELTNFSMVKTHRFQMFFFMLKAIEKEIENDYDGLYLICNDAIDFFNSKEIDTPMSSKSLFRIKKIVALLHRKSYEKAKETIGEVLSIENQKGINYAIALQYKVLIAFRTNNHDDLIDILVSQKEKPTGYLKQVWSLLEAYIHLFIETGKINAPNLPRFKLGKFLNESQDITRDKFGFNTTLLILQIIFLLLRGDKGRDEIADRAESLKKYLRAYTTENPELKRTHLFIKMLLTLPKSSYRKGVVEHKTKKMLAELEATPISVSELEIVPYGRLWAMVMGLL